MASQLEVCAVGYILVATARVNLKRIGKFSENTASDSESVVKTTIETLTSCFE